MASKTLNKFINSSLSLAFLTVTSLATAYCYGWGQALFHGYPWWHVEIGNASMARSLAYVFVTSLLLFLSYATGYLIINKILKIQFFQQIGWLRILMLVSVFTVPVLLTFYVFVGKVPLYLAVIYFVITLLSIMFFHRHWNNVALHLDFTKMLKKQHFWFFNLFIFVYFSVLALCIGYLRADLRQTYDYIQLNGKSYYVLTLNSDNVYIMAEKPKGNHEFVFFNKESQKFYKIQVVKIPN